MRGTGRKARRAGIAVVVALATALLASVALAADPPPQPVIEGDPVVGNTLTASTGDKWIWQRCDPDFSTCDADSAGWSNIGGRTDRTYTVVNADAGHYLRVIAQFLGHADEGSKQAASPRVGPVPEPPPPPPPPLTVVEGQPGPIFDRTGNVTPTDGFVEVEFPNGEVHHIQEVTQIPVGSIVDVSQGHAILTTQRKPGGPLQSTEEWGAAFKFDQKSENAITKLTLVHGAGESANRAERRGHRRGLWGRGHCRCRTSGQNSSGTARGTFYLVKETNEGTVTRVKNGKVLVKNFNNGEKVLLRRGESYLAEKKNR